NFEDMNYLSFYDAQGDRKTQGWTKIMVTHGGDHPLAGNWCPDAHIIGYEHGFINQTADILNMIAGKKPVVPMPDFEDAYKTQQVLEAAMVSAEQRSPVKIADMKCLVRVPSGRIRPRQEIDFMMRTRTTVTFAA